MLLMTVVHTEGPVSPAGVSPTPACGEGGRLEGAFQLYPLPYVAQRAPGSILRGHHNCASSCAKNDQFNGIFMHHETLQACTDLQSHLDPYELSESYGLARVGPTSNRLLSPEVSCSPHRPANPINYSEEHTAQGAMGYVSRQRQPRASCCLSALWTTAGFYVHSREAWRSLIWPILLQFHKGLRPPSSVHCPYRTLEAPINRGGRVEPHLSEQPS